MDKKQLAAAFNEWMRRFIENPDEFKREFQEVTNFVAEQSDGLEPGYGVICAEYLLQLMNGAAPEGNFLPPPATS
jgi:hypothetical protein